MAVDPKYIEEVRDEDEFDYESILDDFGIEASYDSNGDNGIDTTGYMITMLKDMWDDEEYSGRPVLSDVYVTEFKNKNSGEVTVNHKIDLVLFDEAYDEEKEALIFPINLTTDNIDFEKHVVKNVSNQSGLYALAMGMMELKAPKISRVYNHLDVVGLKKLQKNVGRYKELSVKVVQKSFVDKEKTERFYNAFRIVDGQE